MTNEGVTYAELNVAKNPRSQQRKPRGTRSSVSVLEQEITYAEFSFHASQEHPRICGACRCKGFPSPPEKLIAGILGITGFALLGAVIVIATVATPCTEAKAQINSSLTRTQREHPCGHCPKEWMSYLHSCYYIGVERKTWDDSLLSCTSKNSSLLYIESEEELEFLQTLSLVTWVEVFRESRHQHWQGKIYSAFKLKVAEVVHDEYNCALLSSSGLTANNCTDLQIYLCKRKLIN